MITTKKLLFITRKYPPMVGGMEKLSFALAKEFRSLIDTTLIIWDKSQIYLPIIMPYFLIKAIYIIKRKHITHIHLGDALLAPIGLILKIIFKIKVTVTVVGLDITFNFPGYQFIIIRCLKRLDKIICISTATEKECLKRGLSTKCVVIPCGVYSKDFQIKATKKDLEKIIKINLEDKKILITVGRLVKRKGVYWFLKNVLPKLDTKTIYLIIGKGPEEKRLIKLINNLVLNQRVFLLGQISDEELKIIYNTADLFIMPNIKIKENIEGFGIVAIEASSTGLPVIANNVDGVSDAIINNRTGILVETNTPQSMVLAIKKISLRKNDVKTATIKNFSWHTIGKKYIDLFLSLYER